MRKFETKKTRKFGGKVFSRDFHFATKLEAKRHASRLRTIGWTTRVVPHKGVYTVYKRKA